MSETVQRAVVDHLLERDDAVVLVRCESPEVARHWFDAIVAGVGDAVVRTSGFHAAVMRSGARVQVAVDRDGSLCRGRRLTLAVDLAPTPRSRLALLPCAESLIAL